MNNISGFIVAILSAIAFGIYPPAAKIAYADGANPIFIIILTTFFRAFSLVIYCLVMGQSLLPEKRKWRIILSGGLFQSISILGIIGSLAYLPGPVTIMVIFSHTIMLLFYLAFRGEIKLTGLAITSTICALVGLSFVLNVWSQNSDLSLIGLCLAFMAAIATMSRLYVYGKQIEVSPPAVVGAQTFTMAFLFTLTFLFFKTPIMPRTSEGYIWSAICCVSLALGTFGMFFGIKLLGSFRWSLLLKFEPVFTALFSLYFLNEILLVSQYFGMFLVLLSVVSYQILENRRKTVPLVAISTEPLESLPKNSPSI